jgi:hypothetical protein
MRNKQNVIARSKTTKQSLVYVVRLPRLRGETQHFGVQARSRWSLAMTM